ncbi:unnamed protein product [Caenorhabditis angaria]|uniref:glucuronosyltransferase n=1 Tax=Caenorhabditis angaria TaxID=860376 RepID=A0A9P1IVZ6_9PELO|nr:unnamed protein product [Caenorhabditis angaria]
MLKLLLLFSIFIPHDVISLKILIANPILGFSHVKFNAQVADVLADIGHDVTMLNIYHIPLPNLDKLVKNSNVKFIEYRPTHFSGMKNEEHTLPDFWDSIYMNNKIVACLSLPMVVKEKWEPTYSELLKDKKFFQSLKDQDFDAVITETFELGGFYIAHLINARSVIAIMSSVRYPYTEQLFGQPPTLGYIPGDFSRMGKEATVWDRLNDIYNDFFFTQLHQAYSNMQNKLFDRLIGYKLPYWKDLVNNSTVFITNSNPYLDFAAPKTANIIPVGGFNVQKSPKQSLPNEYQDILGENTVIISFGSVVRSYEMPENFKSGFVEMFKKFPNVTFIWKYERDDLEFRKRIGPNVYFKKWMPQSALLADKRVKLFITHGGLASTMEVAYSGKPALVVPLFSDQFHNAMMLSRHGGSIAYNKFDLSKSEKLISAVRELLENSKFAENSKLLAQVLHNQPTDPKQTLINHIEFAAKFPSLKSLVPENNSNGFIAFYYIDAYFCIIAVICLFLFLIRITFKKLYCFIKLKKE